MTRQFTLLTTLYNENNPVRCQEYLYCLERNLHNRDIDSVVIFYEKSGTSDYLLARLDGKQGIKLEIIDDKPTFRELFHYSNEHLNDRNIIIANADIYFDEEHGLNLIRDYDFSGKIFALTRYNKLAHIEKLLREYPDQHGLARRTGEGLLRTQHTNGTSIDSWIFSAPIALDFRCYYTMGVVSCDSCLNYQLLKSKLRVFNPCLDMISIHEHNGWTPDKYQLVLDKNGIRRTRRQWRAFNENNGDYQAGIRFCRLSDTLI